jgi:hypothetical protein
VTRARDHLGRHRLCRFAREAIPVRCAPPGAAERTSASTCFRTSRSSPGTCAPACARLVERRFVLPGLHRIEQVRLDPGYRRRHGETEIGIGSEAHALERAVEARR